MFLIMIPFIESDSPINITVAPVEVVVDTPATYNGNPIEISNGVTLTMENGFTVTMSVESAEIAIAPAEETDEEYVLRLCLQYAEAKPWLGETCEY